MLYLLSMIPWVLTVLGLLFIMVRNKNQEEDMYDFEDEDEILFDEEKETVRVAVYDEKAYWVYENVFYESDVTREPDFSTARPIDTTSMSSKELNQLMIILDELKQSNERE